MTRYRIALLINQQEVFVEVDSDNAFSALNIVRDTYEYDKIISIRDLYKIK